MITRIELKNFMSHEHTVIEPACGLTVISGPNNCGKSAIVTALQVLCYNDESTFVTRHGEKECSIKVFANGHEIEWIRTRNKSTKYIIDGQQFDRLGRGGTPDQLHQILGIKKVSCDNQDFDVHFATQQNPVFLLNDSARAAAQFFASSSDAINLIAMQTRHKQKVRDRKQEARRLAGQLSEVNGKLESLESVPALNRSIEDLESDFARLQASDEEIAALHNHVMAIREKESQLAQLDAQMVALSQLHSPPLLDPTDSLEQTLNRMDSLAEKHVRSSALAKVLASMEVPPTPVDTDALQKLETQLRETATEHQLASQLFDSVQWLESPPEMHDLKPLASSIEQIQQAANAVSQIQAQLAVCQEIPGLPEFPSTEALQNLLDSLNRQQKEMEVFDSEVKSLNDELKNARQQMDDWVKANPHCPTCGAEVDSQTLINRGRGCAHE